MTVRTAAGALLAIGSTAFGVAAPAAAASPQAAATQAEPVAQDPVIATEEELQALAAEIEEGRPIADGTKFTYGGYVQLDAISSEYSGGKPSNPLIDDFPVPSLIPVEPAGGADNFYSSNMHSK